MERIRQLRQAWSATAEHDPRLPVFVLGTGGLVLAVFIGLGVATGMWWLYIVGVLLALTGMLIMFGRRAQSAQYSAIEGQPGAAAAVLNVMRGQWFVTPAVAFTKKQDMVHRVLGRCGIVLVGEGDHTRVRQLLDKEEKRLSRIMGSEVPIHTIVAGNGEDEVPINKLQFQLNKFKRVLPKTEVPRLDRKLKPMDKGVPMPKGYIPNPGKKMR